MEIKKTSLTRSPLCQHCDRYIKTVCLKELFYLDGMYFHLHCLNKLIKYPFK